MQKKHFVIVGFGLIAAALLLSFLIMPLGEMTGTKNVGGVTYTKLGESWYSPAALESMQREESFVESSVILENVSEGV